MDLIGAVLSRAHLFRNPFAFAVKTDSVGQGRSNIEEEESETC